MHDVNETGSRLLAGRRGIDAIPEARILEDWKWHERSRRWVLYLSLSPVLEPTEFVPSETNWYVLVDEQYPRGGIVFYPAKDQGITATFQHQKLNLEGDEGVPWRTGELCLCTNLKALGRRGYDVEPIEEYSRLRWHVGRAIEWLIAASEGRLAEPGDPFELPPFGRVVSGTVAFKENSASLVKWNKISDQFGLLRVGTLKTRSSFWFVRDFETTSGTALVQCKWGVAMEASSSEDQVGLWVRAPRIPIVPPWRFPATWGELRSFLTSVHIDLDAACRSVTGEQFRDGKRHLCLVGFCIPERIDALPSLMSWQAIMLPVLSRPQTSGFRRATSQLWDRDRELLTSSGVQANWIRTENWDDSQIRTRGALPADISSKRIVIIGGGALGSILAELLVRGGVHNLLVLDEEVLEMGNLVRHTLAMNDIGRGKAQALAARLNDLSPNANVGGIGKSLQDLDGPDQIEVLAADMVWDCTGNDDVLHQLEQCSWSSKPIICSLSLSFGARRLFMYVQRSPFSAEAFLTELNPWLLMDLEHAEEPLPREGIGCWHPVFPAAAVDVHLMVALALKSFVGRDKQLSEPNFIVFEQVLNNGQVTGVRQVGT